MAEKIQIDLSGLRERVAHLTRQRVLEAEHKRLLATREITKQLEKENIKEYNEKVSQLILGTNMKPTIVGRMREADEKMCYDFVSFENIEKKDPIEYIDGNKIDYLITNPDKENNKLKEDMPISFLDIKEGEIEKGKEWYKRKDPKLPDCMAELLARYNWGDIKNMPNKKQYKNAQKKAQRKGKDIIDSPLLGVKKGDFVVKFN